MTGDGDQGTEAYYARIAARDDDPTLEQTTAASRTVPTCALIMGCLCAWHAVGAPADEPCDTNEQRARERTEEEDLPYLADRRA